MSIVDTAISVLLLSPVTHTVLLLAVTFKGSYIVSGSNCITETDTTECVLIVCWALFIKDQWKSKATVNKTSVYTHAHTWCTCKASQGSLCRHYLPMSSASSNLKEWVEAALLIS